MSKSQRPFRSTFFTIALVSIIGVSFLSIAVAGTSAAGFSIIDSVSSFFSLQSGSSDADRSARAERIPLDVPLHVYGTGWLRLAEQSLETNGPGLGTTESSGKDDLDGFLSNRAGTDDALHWRALAAVRPDIGWACGKGCTFFELGV
jgi:hypothetical protein